MNNNDDAKITMMASLVMIRMIIINNYLPNIHNKATMRVLNVLTS